MIFSEIVSVGSWWLLAAMLILMCVVIYSIWRRSLRLGYQVNQDELHLSAVNRRLSYIASLPLVAAIVLGLWQPKVLNETIDDIIAYDAVEVEPAALPEVEDVETQEYETMTGATTEVEEVLVMEQEEVEQIENLDDNGDVL
jgi:type VI protein secretion system component VasK